MSKGSKRRPAGVSDAELGRRWEKALGGIHRQCGCLMFGATEHRPGCTVAAENAKRAPAVISRQTLK